MNWIELNSKEILEEARNASHQEPVVLLKYSNRCSLSSLTLDRLERSWIEDEMAVIKTYFLDLIAYRDISDLVAQIFNVRHESPQVLVIYKGECTFHSSHFAVSYETLKDQINTHRSSVSG
ncbi:MAG: bacillithiol system redox-active protein YtxJ [Bacteroidetes bacterium]|nr:bacillithiol system redox-active protein YtxJ [Bacteroidota bacterium]